MAKSWLPRYSELHPDQQGACNLPIRGYYLIQGPAGSGKTLVLLYRAFLQKRRSPDIQIYVYTRVLKKFIQDALSDLQIPDESVRSFYKWVWDLYQNRIGAVPKNPEGKTDFTGMLRNLVGVIERSKGGEKVWDLVLVDEGQDLPPEAYRLLRCFAENITVAADDAQAIYEDSSNIDAIRYVLGLRQDSIHLLRNYRNPRRVARLAAVFLDTPEEQQAFLKSVFGHRSEEQPVLYEASDRQHELDWLCTTVVDQWRQQRSVFVLAVTNDELKRLEGEFLKRGVSVQRVDPRHEDLVNFNDLTPKLIGMFSVKGLECDDVFLPGMIRGVFPSWVRSPKRLLFVAITRAKQKVWISGIKGYLDPLIPQLDTDVLWRVEQGQDGRDEDEFLEPLDDDDLPF